MRPDPKVIPPEIDRWNWGAFFLTWIWGIGNNTFIALLALIPIFGTFIMPFVLGAKGSGWAWRDGRWDSIEHFKRVQRSWAIWGAVIYIVAFGPFVGAIGYGFFTLRHSAAYEMSVAKIQNSAEATKLLGAPITAGFPYGSWSTEGASGTANLNFSVSGPKAAGQVFLDAIKKDGVWSIKSLRLKIDGRDDVIDLVDEMKVEINPSPGSWRYAADGGPEIAGVIG